MKMLDYFKNLKLHEDENAPPEKPKKDKVFIAIIVIFIIMIIFGFFHGDGAQTVANGFNFSVSDGVILAGILIAYIFFYIRGRHKNDR